jgi:hypothetical protein
MRLEGPSQAAWQRRGTPDGLCYSLCEGASVGFVGVAGN